MFHFNIEFISKRNHMIPGMGIHANEWLAGTTWLSLPLSQQGLKMLRWWAMLL
jgi:hypothetical protein